MKKLIVFVVISLFFISASFAAVADVGTCTESIDSDPSSNLKILIVDCTAAVGDIVRTLTSAVGLQRHMLMQVDIKPIVLPTATSDLYIYNDNGIDAAAGQLVDKVTTTSTQVIMSDKPILFGNWRIDLDNNAVAGARIIFKFYLYKL